LDGYEGPLRVAHIMGKMARGGVEAVVMNYYRHIDRTSVQFDFIVDGDSDFIPYDEVQSLGGRVFTVPPYQRVFAYHNALLRLFRRGGYRVAHSHLNTLSLFPLWAASRAGVPVRVAHSHSAAGKGEAVRNSIKYALRPLSGLFPTHYCACSEYAGRWLFGDKLYDSGGVRLIKNAIDTPKFMFDPQIREEVRARLGVAGSLVLGHVGRFTPQKNHAFLLDIFSRVHAARPDSVLLLIGGGQAEGELRNKAERLGLAGSVRFLGVRDDVHRLLQGFDVFALPSLYEGLPVAGVEAQCAGLPCVMSDRITAEALIGGSSVRLPLEAGCEAWARMILQKAAQAHRPEESRRCCAQWDVTKNAAQLRDMYLYYAMERRDVTK
jgi:glycosyltransferase EpsF